MAAELAARFAPTLYFDTDEQWFPTDPRPYTSRQDGKTVVSGFDALNGYHERFTGERPPNPTVFYNAVGYEDSSLAVVQFWFYSVFGQFTTNFHWHDWEVLHVFVDTGLVFAHSGREGDDAESAQGRANSIRGLLRAFESVVDATERATEEATAGNADGADQQLSTVATRLETVSSNIDDASDDLSDPTGTGHAANRTGPSGRVALTIVAIEFNAHTTA